MFPPTLSRTLGSLPALLPQVNVGVFLAELFLCFEVVKPDFVCPKELPRVQGKKIAYPFATIPGPYNKISSQLSGHCCLVM